MGKMSDFLIWAEENDWCMYCERTESMIWSESHQGEAYQAYLDVQKEERMTTNMRSEDLND